MNHTEPFHFGDWTETKVCSEKCFLELHRTCEAVKVEGLTPMDCRGQLLVKDGNKTCETGPCEGNNVLIEMLTTFCVRNPSRQCYCKNQIVVKNQPSVVSGRCYNVV